jgi:hypothetical protein
MLHLSGYNISLNDLKQFRQLDSITPGHPENFATPGIEVSTGPLGQVCDIALVYDVHSLIASLSPKGICNAVGMAIAEAHLRATYAKVSRTIHPVYRQSVQPGAYASSRALIGRLLPVRSFHVCSLRRRLPAGGCLL